MMDQLDKYFHVQATVGEHRSVIVDQLPFVPGQRVEVTICPIAAVPAADAARYPLSGLKVEYDRPFESVAETDWDAAR